MSIKRYAIVASATLALVVPASADNFQRPDRQVVSSKAAQRLRVDEHGRDAAKKTAEDAAKKAVDAAAKKQADETAKEAAKKEADELLARDQALATLKQKPDPVQVKALSKAAAQESRMRDARNAAIKAHEAAAKAKEDAIAAREKEIADQIKSREDAKLAALKAKQEAATKGANKGASKETPKEEPKARAEAPAAQPVAAKAAQPMSRAEAALPRLPRIVGRMPTPVDVPYLQPVAAKP